MNKINSEQNRLSQHPKIPQKFPLTIENGISYLDANHLTSLSLQQLAANLHNYRAMKKEDILNCAHAMGVDYHQIEELERGTSQKIDLNLLTRLSMHYNQKLFISIGDDYV